MTPQEEQLLNSLVERVNQTQLQEKDPDAEELLTRTLGANPDSLYILAQTVLVQNIALDQAKAQMVQLQQQAQQARQPAHATSFLGSLLGRHDPQPVQSPQPPPYQPVNSQYAQPAPPQYAPTQYAQAQYVPVPAGQPSFLRGAMETAAGVAAGALAFEGVESILHGFGHPAYGMGGMGMGPGMMGTGFERPVEETVVNNNYYDDQNQQGMEHHELEHGGEQHFHESADQGGDRSGAQLTDASYKTGDGNDGRDGNDDQGGNDGQAAGDDQGSYDQASNDDSGSYEDSGGDDASGFDDGGGFDGGGDLS